MLFTSNISIVERENYEDQCVKFPSNCNAFWNRKQQLGEDEVFRMKGGVNTFLPIKVPNYKQKMNNL